MIFWNWQHQWITYKHVVMDNAGLARAWKPSFRYLWDFLIQEALLLNPLFFAAMLWAMAAFWKRKSPLMLYCFSMGAPVFLGYLFFTLRSRVLPNWIAPAILPLFCLAVIYWERRWREGARAVKGWLIAGVALGGAAVVVLHNPNMIAKIAGRPLPPAYNPLRRVRAWSDTAQVVDAARRQLRAEGKEVFIIGDHYGMVGQLSFYVPEAKAAVSKVPLAYFRTSDHPANQFYFWPGYRQRRRGENAIFVLETDAPQVPPPALAREFDSVTNLGFHEISIADRCFGPFNFLPAEFALMSLPPARQCLIQVLDYDLAATLASGQAFRWQFRGGYWEGVIGAHWVRLQSAPEGIAAETPAPVADWRWLTDYLQTGLDLAAVLRSFPDDPPLRAAVLAWRGLRLLRQEPWECLASFICSSTKQIVQIQQIIRLLCERFGTPIATPPGRPPAFAFPTPEQLAAGGESGLRACKMGFRAPNLLKTARFVAEGAVDLPRLSFRTVAEARAQLIELPESAPKSPIACCSFPWDSRKRSRWMYGCGGP